MSARDLLTRFVNAVTPRNPPPASTEIVPVDVEQLPAPAKSFETDRYFYLGPDTALARMTNGLYLFVDPRDRSVGAHLIARGYWESWVYKAVCAIIRPGDSVVEVGANFGYYTLAMASIVGPTGRIRSLEANRMLAGLVNSSLKFNGCSGWASVTAKAASDQNGFVTFAVSRENAGGGAMAASGNTVGADTEFVKVPTIRLEELSLPDPRFIRIDAEGSEPLILRGAERLLRRPDVVVCMEWDVVQMSSRADVPEFASWLASLDFLFWRIEYDSSLSPIVPADLPKLKSCDIVMARQYPYA